MRTSPAGIVRLVTGYWPHGWTSFSGMEMGLVLFASLRSCKLRGFPSGVYREESNPILRLGYRLHCSFSTAHPIAVAFSAPHSELGG
jgi:hypothetical protein